MSDSKTPVPNYRFHTEEVFIPYTPPEERRSLSSPYINVSHHMDWTTKESVYGVVAYTHCDIGDDKNTIGMLHLPNKAELFPPPLTELPVKGFAHHTESVKVPIEPVVIRYDAAKRRWELAPGYTIKLRPDMLAARTIGGMQYLPWDPKPAPKA